jgi:hypothetical protein
MNTKNSMFWDVMQNSMVNEYKCFGGISSLIFNVEQGLKTEAEISSEP